MSRLSRSKPGFRQLPLRFATRDVYSFDTLVTGNNEHAIGIVRECALGKGEQQVYIWSAAGGGKTHLLQAACKLAAKHGRTVCYLPAAELCNQPLQVLDDMERLDLVCIDDIDRLVHSKAWQEALFDLINRVRETGNCLLFGAAMSPEAMPVSLPDLRSRLGWGPVFQLLELDDSDKHQALRIRAHQRGLALPHKVAEYLLSHYPRDLFNLFEKLDTLDTASMAMQRKLTIPFIKAVLEEDRY